MRERRESIWWILCTQAGPTSNSCSHCAPYSDLPSNLSGLQGLSDRIDDPAFEPGEEVVSIVSKLMPMCRHGDILFIENALTKLFPLITDLLDWYVGQVLLTETRTPDGIMFKQLGQCIVPPICIKYSYASGEGGCGPLTQAPYSVRELLDLDQVCGFRVFLHLPLTQL